MIEAGRKRIVRGFRRERNDWEVLIKDHHEGYITWRSSRGISACSPTTPTEKAL
nr:hypothetical protein [Bradyrhizobium sp. 23]